MIPMREPFNDARRNLISSIMLASQLELCEVGGLG
jgi:L-asparaginase/Glu-tRNA(Gln) amidotransferase subunit D